MPSSRKSIDAEEALRPSREIHRVLVCAILTLRITAFGHFMKDDQPTQSRKIKFVDIFS